jgi:hypothetical protein
MRRNAVIPDREYEFEAASSHNGQILWTFIVAIAVALAALHQATTAQRHSSMLQAELPGAPSDAEIELSVFEPSATSRGLASSKEEPPMRSRFSRSLVESGDRR